MSNFTVNGVYSYTSANIYSYLGRVPTNSAALERAFDDFDITPTGKTDDFKKLNAAMYEEYSSQVQEQIKNQCNQQDKEDCLQAFYHKMEGNLRKPNHGHQKNRSHQISRPVIGHKQRHQEYHGGHQLNPRI